MDSPAFPKSRDSKLLNDTGTREQFLIELLDMLKDHYEAAKAAGHTS